MALFEIPNLLELTGPQLDQLYNEFHDAQTTVHKEKERRRSLPFVYPQQTAMIGFYREAANLPKFIGMDEPETWAAPVNDLFAYIAGDRVDHDGEAFIATGPGAITTEPGTTNPITGSADWRTEAPELDPESNIVDVQ